MAYQNFFTTRLATDIGTSDATITLETPPTATSGRLALEARNATQREIIKYTGVSGNDITGVTRGQGGTTAKTHLKNSLVEMNATGEDFQDLYDAFASFAASTGSWLTGVTTISAVANNGNRNYALTSSADMTTILSPGMRLRTTRTVAAPTQCATFDGVNDYFSKTTPAGMTFTDDFVVGAWVKLSSYAAGGIITRYNGTSGFQLRLNVNGQPELYGFNGGAGNYRGFSAYQSIPLNKWVHISAQLDMSSYTSTSTTCYLMIDGVEVPISLAQGGTNPTALVQAGNLEIGSSNGGSGFFPGKIAQPFVSSAKITQANVRLLMTQGLTPALITAHSIVSAYSLSNAITDLNTTNANNLTANGGVLATTADSPFGGQADGTISSTLDYGIVAKVTASTITVNVAEGCTIPTSGGVSAVSYSTYKSPYGFPGQQDKWDIINFVNSQNYVSLTSTVVTQIPSTLITAPIGEWKATCIGEVGHSASGAIPWDSRFYLGTSTTSIVAGTAYRLSQGWSATYNEFGINVSGNISTSASTNYYLYTMATGGGTLTGGIRGVNGYRTILSNSYL